MKQESTRRFSTLRCVAIVTIAGTLGFACSEEVAPDDDNIVLRSNPGNGTGSASWTVVAGGSTLVFSVALNDGVASKATFTGTEPPWSALPLTVTNADGEDLHIEKKLINDIRYRVYSGFYEVDIDTDTSASECTLCNCQLIGSGPCQSISTYTDCSSPSTSDCTSWPCQTSGGGVVKIDVGFTSVPGLP